MTKPKLATGQTIIQFFQLMVFSILADPLHFNWSIYVPSEPNCQSSNLSQAGLLSLYQNQIGNENKLDNQLKLRLWQGRRWVAGTDSLTETRAWESSKSILSIRLHPFLEFDTYPRSSFIAKTCLPSSRWACLCISVWRHSTAASSWFGNCIPC